MREASAFLSSFFSWIYPTRCALCGLLGDGPMCDACRQDFAPHDSVRVGNEGSPLLRTASIYPYSGRVGQAVRRLKYARATALAEPMAHDVAGAVERLGLSQSDFVIPIPIHWSRRCMRGFNQSELLCEGLTGVKPGLLARVRRTKPQARLNRDQRAMNLAGAFRAAPEVAGKRVLLVDDVITSGHTANECAKALLEAGASEVSILAFAGEPF